jgi:site-specific DNA-cytosine methylase
MIMFDSSVKQPEDRKILLSDILEETVEKKFYYSEKVLSRLDLTEIRHTGKAGYKKKGVECDKSTPVVTRHHKGMQSEYYPVILDSGGYRNITPVECEKLQTLPLNYTEGVSNTQRYRMIGNGWTLEVVKHILKGLL